MKDVYEWKTYHVRQHAQYSLPDDEHKMFETCRRQEKLYQNINLKQFAFCWLTLHKGKVLSRTGHEGPEGGIRGIALLFF